MKSNKNVYWKEDIIYETVHDYGIFKGGLDPAEVEEVLVLLSKKLKIFEKLGKKRLSNKFNDLAGCNTAMYIEKYKASLMYRWDVQRFANVLFLGTKTYFD